MSKNKLRKTLNHYSKTIILSAIAFLFLTGIAKEISITINLNEEYVKAIEKQEFLFKETAYVLEKKEMLQNDDYLLIYAKGKYYMSENDSEQIFVNIDKNK